MKRFYPLILCLLVYLHSNAQCTQQVIWNNPSFEGTPQPHIPPPGWTNCNGTTTDTQPGNWGVNAPASNGSSYVGLVSAPGWNESCSQTFSPCLPAGQTYNFTVDIIKVDETSDGGGDCDGQIQLWGGNSNGSACDQDELLWTSPVLVTNGPNQNNWITHTLSFTPSQSTCQLTFIAIDLGGCTGGSSSSGDFYCGLDNLSSITPNVQGSATVNQNVSCAGGGNGSVVISASGGTPNYTYNWSNGATGASQTNLAAGTYTVNITDANGCPGQTTVTITQPPAINVSLSSTDANCGQADGSITSTVSGGAGGYSYSWVPSGGNVANPTGLMSGTYTVTVTDVSSCSTTASIGVGNSGGVTSPFSANSLSQCLNGNSFTFTNSGSSGGGITQTWDFGDGSSQVTTVNATYTYAAAGNYVVSHTVTSGSCTSATTTTVTVIQDPDVNAGNASTITCANPSVTLDGFTTTNGATLVWNGPGLTNAADPATATAAGTYTVTANNSGCTAQTTITIGANTSQPNIQINAPNTVLDCSNPTATLVGLSSTSGATFIWSGPAGVTNGDTLVVNTAGTYTLTVTDPSNGCTDTQTQNVTQNGSIPNISVNATDDTLSCTTITISLTGNSTTSGVTLDWSGPAGAIIGNPINVTSTGTYTLTVTDPTNGCVVTQTYSVGQNTVTPTANAVASDSTLNCNTQSSTLTGSSSASNAIFSWTGTGGAIPGNPVSVSVADTYTLSVTDNSNGCTSTQTIVITTDTTTPAVSVLPANAQLSCTTTSVSLVATASNVTYSWSGSGSGNSSSLTATTQGTYIVTVADSTNGCTNSDTVTINTNTTPPNISASVNGSLTCIAPAATLNGNSSTSGATYSWSGPNSYTSASQNPSVTQGGAYTLTVTDPNNGCTSTTSVSVASNTVAPGANAGSDDTLACSSNATLNLNGTSGTSNTVYSWSGPSGFTSSLPNPAVDTTGQYILTVTDTTNGCTSTDTVYIATWSVVAAFNASPSSGFSPLTTNFTNTSVNATAYFWDLGNGASSITTNPVGTYSNVGTYTVTLIATNGPCLDTATAIITVDANASMEVPNIFTPNGDGINDEFTIKCVGISELKGVIFNRWGQQVFELLGPSDKWDGRTNDGDNATSGTYFLLLKAKGYDGTEIEKEYYIGLYR